MTGWGRAWRLGKEGARVGPTLRMPRPLAVAPPALHALGLVCGVRLEPKTGSAPLTPARGPAVTFDLAAAADQEQRGLDPSAAGAPVGMASLCSGGLGTDPCPLLKHEIFPHPLTGDLVSFCSLPPLATWWD